MNMVWLKWEPAVLGQRRKRRWSLRAPGGRKGAWLSGIRVRTWQNGKSVWSEKIQCGRKKDHLRQMSSFPTSTQQDWTIPSVSHRKSLVSLFLELGRITDGSLVSTLPSVISIGFALPSKKAKRLHSREIPVTQSCNWILLRYFFIHSTNSCTPITCKS